MGPGFTPHKFVFWIKIYRITPTDYDGVVCVIDVVITIQELLAGEAGEEEDDPDEPPLHPPLHLRPARHPRRDSGKCGVYLFFQFKGPTSRILHNTIAALNCTINPSMTIKTKNIPKLFHKKNWSPTLIWACCVSVIRLWLQHIVSWNRFMKNTRWIFITETLEEFQYLSFEFIFNSC